MLPITGRIITYFRRHGIVGINAPPPHPPMFHLYDSSQWFAIELTHTNGKTAMLSSIKLNREFHPERAFSYLYFIQPKHFDKVYFHSNIFSHHCQSPAYTPWNKRRALISDGMRIAPLCIITRWIWHPTHMVFHIMSDMVGIILTALFRTWTANLV